MLELVSGLKKERKIDPESVEAREARQLVYMKRRRLLDKWSCAINVNPPWCVYGNDETGGYGIVYWIRPGEESAFAAQQIATLTNELGGRVGVKRTEYHPEGEEDTSARSEDVIASLEKELVRVSIEQMCKTELESALKSALIYRAEGKEEVAWEVYSVKSGKEELLYKFPKMEEDYAKPMAEDTVKILLALAELHGEKGKSYKLKPKRHLRVV